MFYLYEELPQFEDVVPGEGSPPLYHHRPAPQQLSLDCSPAQGKLHSYAVTCTLLHHTDVTPYPEENTEQARG